MRQQKKKMGGNTRPECPRRAIGIISITKGGFGFVEIAGQEDDVLVASENLNCALHKDEVEIELSKKKLRGKTTGKVLSVKKRSKTDFSGKVIHKNGKVFLKPDDIRFYADILLISGAEKASDGDKAVVTLESFNNPLKPPEGRLIQIIGKHGENDAEMRSIKIGRASCRERV